jgi:hypothetical protein
MDDLEDDQPKKTPRATIIRRAIVFALAFACAGGWIYTRYLVKKETLGGRCSYDMHCRTEAPRCLKESAEGEGVCSRACDTDGDCAPDIKCVKVELDEYDDRGRPLQGGYCFPQALLDARRAKRNGVDGGTAKAKSDSWIDVPEAPGQFEGEIVLDQNGTKTSYEVKGTLLQTNTNTKNVRTLVDTTTLRVYTVNDDKKTFAATQLGSAGGDATVSKTDKKDTVADRSCDLWKLEDGKTSREACVLQGAAFIDPSSRAPAAWEKELSVRGVFPLRVTEGSKTKLVAVRVDAHAVPAAHVAIPKSYRNLASR